MNMLKHAFILAALVLSSGSVMAQERSAVMATDEAPMTWKSLKDNISSFDTKVDDLTARIGRLVICGRNGWIYAPGAGDADADGCVATNKAVNTTPDLTQLSYKISSIMGCGGAQKFFNGSGCIAAVVSAPAQYRWVAAGGGSSSLPDCPAGVGNICSPQGAVCKTTTASRNICMGNQCNGMGYQTVYSYNRFVCN